EVSAERLCRQHGFPVPIQTFVKLTSRIPFVEPAADLCHVKTSRLIHWWRNRIDPSHSSRTATGSLCSPASDRYSQAKGDTAAASNKLPTRHASTPADPPDLPIAPAWYARRPRGTKPSRSTQEKG